MVHHWGITMGNAGWGWMGSEYNNKILLTVETDAHNQSLDGEYQQTIALETEIQMWNVQETNKKISHVSKFVNIYKSFKIILIRNMIIIIISLSQIILSLCHSILL